MRRIVTGNIAHLSNAINENLKNRITKFHQSHLEALADIADCVLIGETINNSELAILLPPTTNNLESKFYYIYRFLNNKLIILCMIDISPAERNFFRKNMYIF